MKGFLNYLENASISLSSTVLIWQILENMIEVPLVKG